jgi:hypothetical protein
VRVRRAIAWSAGRIFLVAPLAWVAAIVGFLAFFPPYRTTGWIVDRVRLKPDERSTWKLMVGIGVYGAWVGGVALVAAVAAAADGRIGRGLLTAGIVLLALPLGGMVGLAVRERWRGTWRDARRFFLLRSRRTLMAQLRKEQRALATRLDTLYQRYAAQGALS